MNETLCKSIIGRQRIILLKTPQDDASVKPECCDRRFDLLAKRAIAEYDEADRRIGPSMDEDLNRDMWQNPEMKHWLEGAQANPRMGTPADLAPLAVFLSGSGSDYITGSSDRGGWRVFHHG